LFAVVPDKRARGAQATLGRAQLRDPYRVISQWANVADAVLKHDGLWLWVPAPVRNCAQGGDDSVSKGKNARHTFRWMPRFKRGIQYSRDSA